MYLLLVEYIKPLAEVDAVREPHRAYLDKYFASGHFIFAGRRKSCTGGVILCRAASPEEVQALVGDDPYTQTGVARYEIIEFTPGKYAEAFAPFIESRP